MVCPYCGGRFRVRRRVWQDDDRLHFGLVECRCFVFPVVDGILLLSLAKGYGGAEEALQPYGPLQVAAVRHLESDDVAGLRGWMRRHMPLAADLVDGTDEPYLAFAERVAAALSAQVRRFLDDYGRYEVVGTPRSSATRRLRTKLPALRGARSGPRSAPPFPTTDDFYAARYFSPRVNALALQLGALPPADRILSLCCGHGV